MASTSASASANTATPTTFLSADTSGSAASAWRPTLALIVVICALPVSNASSASRLTSPDSTPPLIVESSASVSPVGLPSSGFITITSALERDAALATRRARTSPSCLFATFCADVGRPAAGVGLEAVELLLGAGGPRRRGTVVR